MKCIVSNLSGHDVILSYVRAVRSLFAGILVRLLVIVTFVLGTVTTANASTVPVSSSFLAQSTVDGIADTDFPSQGATLNPFNPSTTKSGGQMVTTAAGSANWSSPSSLTVEIDLTRFDTHVTGTSLSFYTRGVFDYTFTVPADTTVTVDYDVIATSTSTSTSGTARWWGMGDFVIGIDNSQFHSIDTGFTSAPSPNIFLDSVTFNILAGTHTIKIEHAHNGTGNFPGDRTANGEFNVTIGDLVPEPTSFVLATLGLLSMGCRRRKWA